MHQRKGINDNWRYQYEGQKGDGTPRMSSYAQDESRQGEDSAKQQDKPGEGFHKNRDPKQNSGMNKNSHSMSQGSTSKNASKRHPKLEKSSPDSEKGMRRSTSEGKGTTLD